MSAYIPLAASYDELTQDVPYEAFADFYEQIFARYGMKPQMLLDLACGTGTLTCILANRGYEMIGTDASGEMLSQAMEKAADLEESKRPMLLCQSMEELDLYGTVSAAVCSLDGFNYLPPDTIPEVLRRLRLFIEPGGLLIFDVNTPEKLMGLDGEVFIDETDDVFCVWRAEFDYDENACIYGMDIFSLEGDTWQRSQEEHVEYAHSCDFLSDALVNAGFGEISVFAELHMEEPRDGENRIFFAARRL